MTISTNTISFDAVLIIAFAVQILAAPAAVLAVERLCKLETSTDFKGNDLMKYNSDGRLLNEYPIASTFECARLCYNDADCFYFTHVFAKCYMKTTDKGRTKHAKAVSGVCPPKTTTTTRTSTTSTSTSTSKPTISKSTATATSSTLTFTSTQTSTSTLISTTTYTSTATSTTTFTSISTSTSTSTSSTSVSEKTSILSGIGSEIDGEQSNTTYVNTRPRTSNTPATTISPTTKPTKINIIIAYLPSSANLTLMGKEHDEVNDDDDDTQTISVAGLVGALVGAVLAIGMVCVKRNRNHRYASMMNGLTPDRKCDFVVIASPAVAARRETMVNHLYATIDAVSQDVIYDHVHAAVDNVYGVAIRRPSNSKETYVRRNSSYMFATSCAGDGAEQLYDSAAATIDVDYSVVTMRSSTNESVEAIYDSAAATIEYFPTYIEKYGEVHARDMDMDMDMDPSSDSILKLTNSSDVYEENENIYSTLEMDNYDNDCAC